MRRRCGQHELNTALQSRLDDALANANARSEGVDKDSVIADIEVSDGVVRDVV